MASIVKRSYVSWQVAAKSGTQNIKKTFLDKPQAQAFMVQLEAGGIDSKLSKTESLAWQVRIRKKGYPALAETFQTKADAQAWAIEREAEMVQRKFVDYREAERQTLGDLLRKYQDKFLKDKTIHHPDVVRIQKICRHPIANTPMHMLQKADVAAYRDERLTGGFVESDGGRKLSVEERTWRAVKGSTVTKELELMARIIKKAMQEWNIHIPINPASGLHCARPEPQAGDERNRRLEDLPCATDLDSLAARNRRQRQDVQYTLDADTYGLLKAAGGEQINLLRACRYPEWFRPQKTNVSAATLRARRKAKVCKVKARLRKNLRLWAIVSFAIETAMRRGEMVNLRWEYVHHCSDGMYVVLPAAITKTGKERVVPLTLRAQRILKTQPRTSDLVFNTNSEALKTAYRRAKEKVKIQNLRMHDLRHEATSRLFERTNLRDLEIGALTGHEDARSLRRYTNLRAPTVVKRFHASFN